MSYRMFSALLLFALLVPSANAQGLRVSATVKDALRLNAAGNEQTVANNFSLFQGGRVYDYVEAAGEVVIFDRSADQFIVLNLERNVFTRITFVELQKMLPGG